VTTLETLVQGPRVSPGNSVALDILVQRCEQRLNRTAALKRKSWWRCRT